MIGLFLLIIGAIITGGAAAAYLLAGVPILLMVAWGYLVTGVGVAIVCAAPRLVVTWLPEMLTGPWR